MATHFLSFKKMCLAHLNVKANMCAKFNMKTYHPTFFA